MEKNQSGSRGWRPWMSQQRKIDRLKNSIELNNLPSSSFFAAVVVFEPILIRKREDFSPSTYCKGAFGVKRSNFFLFRVIGLCHAISMSRFVSISSHIRMVVIRCHRHLENQGTDKAITWWVASYIERWRSHNILQPDILNISVEAIAIYTYM